MGLRDLGGVSSFAQDLTILFDEYWRSTTSDVSNSLATIFWISSGLTGIPWLPVAALILHIVPPIPYYIVYGPFGIEFDYTPMMIEDGRLVPDIRAKQDQEAVLYNDEVTIRARVSISDRIDEFSIKFDAPRDLEVELRDIPMSEHVYDRDDKILSATNINNREFNLVIDVYGEDANRGENYPLKIRDMMNNRNIETIDIIS